MRARYYNPEIRRFINQDIVTGSIENSQSLNRYSYCQGNPVNYFDPFGLEPCEFFTGLGHGMLNLLGLIRGIGDVFDITNAIWYALEGNWGRCFEAGIAAIPFIGNFLPDRRTCDYVRRALNIVSYGGTGFLAGQGVVDGGKALWADISSGQCSGWSIFLGVANIGLNGATFIFSGKGFIQETGNLNKMLKADGVYDNVGNFVKNNKSKFENINEPIAAGPSLVQYGKGYDLKEAATKLSPVEGYTDVVIHGTPDSFGVWHNGKWEYIDQRSLATFLKNNPEYNGGAIRLISCSTGANSNGIAQHLSNKLGVNVLAPTDTLYISKWNYCHWSQSIY